MDKSRFETLVRKIDAGKATEAEHQEYMKLLKEEGEISDKEITAYNKSEDKKFIITVLLSIGFLLLAAWGLGKLKK